MANDLKGEVRFEVDGTAYKMRFGNKVLYEQLEKPLGMSVGDCFEKFTASGYDIGLTSQLIYAGLHEFHSDVIDMDKVFEMMDEIGPIRAKELINEGLLYAFKADGGAKKKRVKK